MPFAVGSVVSARGRDWIVLPTATKDVLNLKPVTGVPERGRYVRRQRRPALERQITRTTFPDATGSLAAQFMMTRRRTMPFAPAKEAAAALLLVHRTHTVKHIMRLRQRWSARICVYQPYSRRRLARTRRQPSITIARHFQNRTSNSIFSGGGESWL